MSVGILAGASSAGTVIAPPGVGVVVLGGGTGSVAHGVVAVNGVPFVCCRDYQLVVCYIARSASIWAVGALS